jgi:hypothetical protein
MGCGCGFLAMMWKVSIHFPHIHRGVPLSTSAVLVEAKLNNHTYRFNHTSFVEATCTDELSS